MGLGHWGAMCAKCPNDRFNCDEYIEWDSRNTCTSLERDWGCDCSGCHRCADKAKSSGPNQNAAELVMLREAQHPNARCLDGSMAGYYIRHGTANKYLVYFEGGAWCYDSACERPTRAGTLKNCWSRANGRLGSSKRWTRTQDSRLGGMLSADPHTNPVFHDWTLVYLPYCDGASFSGDAVVEGIHFRGEAILHAVVAELKATTSIRHAEFVVLSGGSSGGSSVFYHGDAVATELQLESGEVLALPDAGFFLDIRDKDGVDCWPSQMRSLFDVANGYQSLHRACLARFPKQRWKCLFPENFADLLSTRTLVINSLYDSSESWYTLRLECCLERCWGAQRRCNHEQLRVFLSSHERHVKAWAPLVTKAGNGVWAPACIEHTLTRYYWTDPLWAVPAHSNNTLTNVVGRWLAKDDADDLKFFYQDRALWPDNTPCAARDAKQNAAAIVAYRRAGPSILGRQLEIVWLGLIVGIVAVLSSGALYMRRRKLDHHD